MPPTRADDPPSGIRVVREIPLWGLLGALAIGVCQAGAWWFQTQRQSEQLARQEQQLSNLTQQMGEISKQLSSTNLKDLEHDLKITSLTNRMTALEALYPRQILSGPGPARTTP